MDVATPETGEIEIHTLEPVSDRLWLEFLLFFVELAS